jgi:hypothetical protein
MNTPEWFKLDNYKPSKDAEYWIVMLNIRKNLRAHLNRTSDKESKLQQFRNVIESTKFHAHINTEEEKKTAQFTKKIFATGNSFPSILPLNVFMLEDLKNWSAGSAKYLENLQELHRLQESESNVRLDQKTNKTGEMEKEISGRNFKPLNSFEGLQDGVILPGYEPFLVNLSKNTQDIVNDIKKLKAELKPEFIRDKNREKLYTDIWSSGVLPFFDLKVWFEIKCIEAPFSSYGPIIWPELVNSKIDLTERIKKTTKKYYDKVFTEDFLNSLS